MNGKASGMTRLAEAVRDTPPEEFAALRADETDDLASIIERAAAERAALIDRAIEDSLRYLPAMLRGPVKRALGV